MLLAGLAGGAAGSSSEEPPRPRVRDLGVSPGVLAPGPFNAITDVPGVRVGQRTLIAGETVRTGVTAILPHGGNLFQRKVPAAAHTINGFGKAAGFLQVQELGTLETPVVLTNTLAVGTSVEAVVRWTLEQPGNEGVGSVNAVVGETNDGYLNDIRSLPVTAADVRAALDGARGGTVAEGSVGAGTGTRALGWKGGIGTASRRLPGELGGHTVGALAQSNFGGILRLDGIPVGEALGRIRVGADVERAIAAARGVGSAPAREPGEGRDREEVREGQEGAEDGSVMIVLATDAPLSSRQLERLARRAALALGRVGSYVSHGSGDFVIAFSTVPEEAGREPFADQSLDPFFLAAVESVEEAIYNSLTRATTVTGFEGRTVEAIPVDALGELLTRHVVEQER
jgi:D-aminopeptidase